MAILQPSSVSLRSILLATDFSPIAQAALRHTVFLARRFNARLYVLHVTRSSESRSLEDAWREAQRCVTDLFIAGELDGVEYELIVDAGDTAEVIVRRASDLRVDLLTIGSQGHTGLGKILLGSVAERVFRLAACPVLTVGPKAASTTSIPVQRLVFATGFSGHSIKAGAYALSIAERQSACLTVMYVVTEPLNSELERKKIADESLARLESLIPADPKLSCPPEFVVEFGTAAERIVHVATQRQANLIVLGVRQPAGFARRLRWATAYSVTVEAPCPVLTVRKTEP